MVGEPDGPEDVDAVGGSPAGSLHRDLVFLGETPDVVAVDTGLMGRACQIPAAARQEKPDVLAFEGLYELLLRLLELDSGGGVEGDNVRHGRRIRLVGRRADISSGKL